jgi:hypothetical protein
MIRVINVRTFGAKGDGSTDDTVILNSVLSYAANLSSVHLDGHMRIVNILELLSCCHDLRPSLSDDTGADGNFQCIHVGIVEIQDMLFTVSGPTAGAILVEWNVAESVQGSK